jgi:CAAX protease family protein
MKNKIHPNIWQSIVYVLILLVSSFGYFFLLYTYADKISQRTLDALEFIGKFIYFLPLIFVLIKQSGVNLKEQIFIPKLIHIALAIFFTGVSFFLYFLLAYPEDHPSKFTFSLSFFGMVILVPIFEEIFFRGLILHQLLMKYKAHTAILFSSFLFAISHLNIRILIPLFLFSILVSYLYYRFKQSLIIVIVAHVVWNFLVQIM